MKIVIDILGITWPVLYLIMMLGMLHDTPAKSTTQKRPAILWVFWAVATLWAVLKTATLLGILPT